MARALALHPDRLFPADPTARAIARRLYAHVAGLPIISPHGHCDPAWFATDAPFPNPTALLLAPDHYLLRMLYSQGVALEQLGVAVRDGDTVACDARTAWRTFGAHYHLFRGTPSRLWLDWVFAEVFGLEVRLDATTADLYYDTIDACLARAGFRPRALFERFGIEVLATTESPLDELAAHAAIRASGWGGRVITAFRPDPVLDPEHEDFRTNLVELGRLTDCDTGGYDGYLEALRRRRAAFRAMGATSTDHGHPSARTADLDPAAARALYRRVTAVDCTPEEADLFRAHMLTVMAGMSLEDGMVMQLHPGSFRNHNPWLFGRFGRDRGADLPQPCDYVHALKPLLDRYGNERDLTLILFTLDESNYARELAPLAGHYPSLRLGPAWWFHDSPEGMRRMRRQCTETAGFYNTVGFNDDTRAFCSIPARHDVARRIDCGYLAELVAEHQFDETEAAELAVELAGTLVRKAYRL
ncbi:MAG: glucuronate isomerase [Pseudomonadales bacterium]|jgi:glucuronate isomerase|nr:glucuronate isomerase [Pseudomonadales bacterium]MCP5320264.1 glucuronate isomerase [Pseudomonadales bacterium]MCP5337811.1 glucuronate isomerase [Pseudomonadales bacterium]